MSELSLSDIEKEGLKDFFGFQELQFIIKLAKTVTKNVVTIDNAKDAFEVICLHSQTATIVLNKKIVTKEMLFKYLHHNRVSIQSNFTKSFLIEEILKLWRRKSTNSEEVDTAKQKEIHLLDEQNFPIHLLSRKFSEWFYENYNKDELKTIDLWIDSKLDLTIEANDGCQTEEVYTSEFVIEALKSIRRRFNFFFNPNLCHNGVQGRMEAHGMVCVLCCGTLHTQDKFVGLFESAFGLLRDPASENNWKIKSIKMLLRSDETEKLAILEESKSLKVDLALPTHKGPIN